MISNDLLRTDEAERHDSIVLWLKRPETYAHHPREVEFIETHISRVFLAGDRVFKLKKPVRFDFLDFSTTEKREQACRDEVRLNRRMAGNVYCGVHAITRGADGDYELDGSGQVLDWVVEMRRLPADRILEDQLCRGTVPREDLDRLTRFLARFYAEASRLHIAPEDYVRTLIQHVEANRRSLQETCTDAVQRHRVRRIHTAQLRLLGSEPELFTDRVRGGRIVEGHGDLRPEHVCLLDPPVIFDCIEFSADFRRVDALDELCFLAMECDRLHSEYVGESILAEYRLACTDSPAARLVAFYKSYRAVVRAKVAALRANQLRGALHYAQCARAEQYLTLADRYLCKAGAGPLLIVVCGLMGSGKSTLARLLSE